MIKASGVPYLKRNKNICRHCWDMSSLESLRRGAIVYLSSMVSKEPTRMLINASEHCPVKQTELAVRPGMHAKGQSRLLEKESSTP